MLRTLSSKQAHPNEGFEISLRNMSYKQFIPDLVDQIA